MSEATAVRSALRLQVEGLRVCLADSDTDVVDEVSFSVRGGEVLGLVGESGSGKTTVALALLGHTRRGLRLAGGRVIVDGQDLLAATSAELRELRGAKVAYVPQDPAAALNPALRVGTQLREALTSHRRANSSAEDIDRRIADVLTEVRLGRELLARYPHQLSGGQQQRIAIAMAFACRPALIVLDEPTTGLDVTTQAHVLETIQTMRTHYGVAAVYVSHDLAVVGELAESVAVMYAGRIIEHGPAGEIFKHPAHPYTAGLLRAVPSTKRAEELEGIEGKPPRPASRPRGCAFAPRCALVTDACRTAPPPVVTLGGGQSVRCVRAGEAPVNPLRAARLPLARSEGRSTGAVLEVIDLSARYDQTEVLHGVRFGLSPRSCLAVVGESGSGKTTLARCLVGMHANWTGEIRFAGESFATSARARPKEALRRIQYVFQNPYTSLNPRKTIGQIVSQPLEHFYDLRRSQVTTRVASVLEDVSLSADFASRRPDELSGGERQRVAIARALVVEPDLLVCDEVTSSLDVSVQAIIVQLLRQLQMTRQMAMVFITHNLALVRGIAQEVVVLSAGTVKEQGPVGRVLDHPQDPYTVRLLDDMPKLELA